MIDRRFPPAPAIAADQDLQLASEVTTKSHSSWTVASLHPLASGNLSGRYWADVTRQRDDDFHLWPPPQADSASLPGWKFQQFECRPCERSQTTTSPLLTPPPAGNRVSRGMFIVSSVPANSANACQESGAQLYKWFVVIEQLDSSLRNADESRTEEWALLMAAAALVYGDRLSKARDGNTCCLRLFPCQARSPMQIELSPRTHTRTH